jgi:YVTN family beta-propeller protein
MALWEEPAMTRILGRRLAVLLAALLCATAAVAAGSPGAVSAAAARTAPAGGAARLAGAAPGLAAHPAAGPGTNLLLNPGAQAGAVSARGWDAVTIPGWQVSAGLPTVVHYGVPHLSPATGRWPAVTGGSLFVGGAGGTARLTQVVPLRQPAGPLLPGGTRYHLSGWLSGTVNSWATVKVRFLSATGQVLGHRAISHGHAGDRVAHRAATGTLPAGTATARVTLVLGTSLTNDDGEDAPIVGYDRAVADGLRFSVSAPVRRPPPLTPPAVHVPRYQHVFLFYFENEDFGSVFGNTKQAPYLNSLVPQSSVLANFFAEEHPSDANYLALAGGSAFGIPLTDPLEENSQYTIRARNIGDLIGAQHETWKAYLQSANGPCDDTVHRYYWNDDEPMTYFADVRDRPAYCAAHLVPLPALQTDLASADTTPNFAWVAPDDCADMEGCGILAGDKFLATELGAIMRSPAWRTQRSLAIITFDEDGYDHEHPAQRVLTLMLGSTGVRQGYVSHVRYTHYSLLRTIEAALGTRTLTRNDGYAQPVNDVFSHGPAQGAGAADQGSAGALAPPAASGQTAAGAQAAAAQTTGVQTTGAQTTGAQAAGAQTAMTEAQAAAPQAAAQPLATAQRTAFVVNSGGTVTPISLATRRAGKPIKVGANPEGIAVTPNGRTAYVANYGSNTVTPIDTATRQAGQPISVGGRPFAIAVTPNGRTAYVANYGSGTVTPIDTATNHAGQPIKAGLHPRAIAITPNGRTAYVLDWGSATVTPIDTATNQAGQPIKAGLHPRAIAITPNGRTAYVLDWGSATVTPIDTATNQAGPPIRVGSYPFAIAIAPNGRTAYVANYGSGTVTPIDVRSGRPGHPIPAGQAPNAIAVTPGGGKVFVVGGDSDTLTPIRAGSGRAGRGVPVGYAPTAVAISRRDGTAYVVNTVSGTLTPVSTRTGVAGPPIHVGIYTYPTAIALTGTTAVVVGTYAGQVMLVNTSTQKVIARVTAGTFPVAVAIAG